MTGAEKTRRLITDILGVLLIIAAALLGWVPGPGGIPLLLAGLGLLAINHTWARNWLNKIRDSGNKLSNYIFPDHAIAQLVYDFATVLAILAGYYILMSTHNYVLRSAALLMFAVALSIFLFNRRRLEKVIAILKNRKN